VLAITGLGGASLDSAELAELAADGTTVSVASILDKFPVDPTASHCSVVSTDGSYRASIPIDDLRQGGLLSYAVPRDLGGPIRLTVTQGSTLCWNVKDVGELRFTQDHEPDSVPAKPSH